MIKLETKGDIRVIPCPHCGVSLKIANMSPHSMSRVSVNCTKCLTIVDVTRRP